MKKLIYLFVVAILASGCATAKPQTYKETQFSATKKIVNASLEKTFLAVEEVFKEKGYPVYEQDREAGYIRTDYIEVKKDILKSMLTGQVVTGKIFVVRLKESSKGVELSVSLLPHYGKYYDNRGRMFFVGEEGSLADEIKDRAERKI